MNKPAGFVCQRHPREPNVYDLIPKEWRSPELVSFGRLDRDTTGMLLLGTDGGTQSLLMFPGGECSKQYRVRLAEATALSVDAADAVAAGLVLEDGTRCVPASLEVISHEEVRLTLHEGIFHQVKRMVAAVGGQVAQLHRERIGPIADENLALGEMRALTQGEMRALCALLPRERKVAKELPWKRRSEPAPRI